MTRVLTDIETDAVGFSPYIKHYMFWKMLKYELERRNIFYFFLPHTKDIWARDYMPIQTNQELVLYNYEPDYLLTTPKLARYITKPQKVCQDLASCPIKKLNLVLDGGNVIKTPHIVIMTEKVLCENCTLSPNEIKSMIKNALGADIILIPWDMNEKYGHSDGMVRYLHDNTVLINNYCDYDKVFRAKLIRTLEPYFDIKELTYGKVFHKLNWAYINYLQIGQVIFMPTLGYKEDYIAMQELEWITNCEIIPLYCRSLVEQGGGLNCISWNVNIGAMLCHPQCDSKQVPELQLTID